MATYQFYTDCTNSDAVGSYGECINEMVQSPHCEELDSHDFMLNIAQQHHFQEGLAELFNHTSLTDAADDFALSCYRSRFQGQPCYYVKFSGIEHIFVDERSLRHLVSGDELRDRLSAMDAVGNALDDDDAWNRATTPEAQIQALTDFVEQRYPTFVQHHILLGSLFAYSNPFQEMVRTLDQRLLIQPATVRQTLNLYVYSPYPLLRTEDSARQFSAQIQRLIESKFLAHFPDEDPVVFAVQPPIDHNTLMVEITHTGPCRPRFAELITEAVHHGAKGLQCDYSERWSFLKNTAPAPAPTPEPPALDPRPATATLRR